MASNECSTDRPHTNKDAGVTDYIDKFLQPFTAKHSAKYSQPTRVTVIGLSDSGDEPMFDETYGVYCEARRERGVITVPIGLLKNAEGHLPPAFDR